MCCIASMQTRMQVLLTDLEEVSSSEMATEKQFTSILNTYKWIATTIQHSESDVLKEELKELTNMGTQLGKPSMTRGRSPWILVELILLTLFQEQDEEELMHNLITMCFY